MFIQDKNFNFIEIENEKISEIIKDKFVVALDFDGVVTNPHELKTQYINELGYSITPEQCGRYTCINVLRIPLNDYEKGSIRSYTETPVKLPLEKIFIKNFNKLKNLEEIAIFFVTSRYDDMLHHLHEYTKYHKIKVDGIINTENKNKTQALKLINPKIFIDDSPKKLSEILEKEPKFYEKCSLILYRNIANKIKTNPNKKYIYEVDNWDNLTNIIIKHYDKFYNKS